MIDLKLNPVTRDLVIPIVPVEGAARIAQAVGIRLRTMLSEWFLDTSHGVPYFQRILVKNPPIPVIESILRRQILTVEGVLSIESFRFSYNPQTRVATAEFSAKSVEGLITNKLDIKNQV